MALRIFAGDDSSIPWDRCFYSLFFFLMVFVHDKVFFYQLMVFFRIILF